MSDTEIGAVRERLVHLVTSGALDELETAWLEAMERGTADLEAFLETARMLNRIGERDRASVLLLMLHDETATSADPRDRLRMLEIVAANRPSDPEVRRKVTAAVREAYRAIPALGPLLDRSGLEGSRRIPDALAVFEEFTRFTPGTHLFHATGWGTGRITRIDERTGELTVDFERDKGHRIPIESACEVFEILDDEDIRVYRFSRSDELREMAAGDPGHVLRLVLRGRGGKATSTEIRNDLRGAVIDEALWTRWWGRARKEAAKDPYIEIQEGSKPVLALRDRPIDVADEALRSVQSSGSLAETVAQARSFIRTARGSVDLPALVGIVAARLADPEQAAEAEGEGQTLEALLFVDDMRSVRGGGEVAPVDPSGFLRRRIGPDIDAAGLPAERASETACAILGGIKIQEYRNRFLDLLREVRPADWKEIYPTLLRGEGPDLWDLGTGQLCRDGYADIVAEMIREMMEEPERAPNAFLAFARGFLQGRYKGVPDLPDRVTVVLRLLSLYERLHKRSSTLDPSQLKKLLQRLESLLLDPKHRHLAGALRTVSAEEMGRILHETEVSPYLSDDLKSAIQTTVARTHPALLQARQKPFWEEDRVYCTADAVRAKKDEFRHLTEVKIPENSRAVGAAAALGDLSENSEYTYALEQQRLLTQKATELRAALDRARALENQHIPEGIAAPGTRVRVRHHDSGEDREFRVLGPWDVGSDEKAISYLSPLGRCLLGRKVGDEVRAELPGGSATFTILEIERLF